MKFQKVVVAVVAILTLLMLVVVALRAAAMVVLVLLLLVFAPLYLGVRGEENTVLFSDCACPTEKNKVGEAGSFLQLAAITDGPSVYRSTRLSEPLVPPTAPRSLAGWVKLSFFVDKSCCEGNEEREPAPPSFESCFYVNASKLMLVLPWTCWLGSLVCPETFITTDLPADQWPGADWSLPPDLITASRPAPDPGSPTPLLDASSGRQCSCLHHCHPQLLASTPSLMEHPTRAAPWHHSCSLTELCILNAETVRRGELHSHVNWAWAGKRVFILKIFLNIKYI